MELVKKCPICKSSYYGRRDKKFCSTTCKSDYHHRLRRNTAEATIKIDRILHRNRSILLELMGKNRAQVKVPLLHLEQRRFNFNYVTKYHVNTQGKTYNHVYDFAWMTFSSDEVLIVKRRT